MRYIIKIFFLLTLILFSAESLSAQAVTWQRVFPSPQPDYGRDGIQTFDGGFIITAARQSIGGGNFLLKLDSYGNEEWSKIIDSVGLSISIKQTKDSGYILAGGSSGFAMLTKTDRLGNVLWKKLYTIDNNGSTFRKVKISKKGDFILCGVISFPPKAFVVKTDSNGNVIYNLSFSNNSYSANAYDINESNDGSIYLTGLTVVNNKSKTLIAKISDNFQLHWVKSFGTEGKGDAQSGISIIPYSDTELFLTGSYSFFYSTEVHFTKIDSSGNVIFQNILPQVNESNSMCKTSAGNFAIAGGITTISDDILFLLLNRNGDILSRKIFNSSGTEGDFSESIYETNDNGFLITGFTSFLNASNQDYNIYEIKTDSVGNAPVNIRNIQSKIPVTFELYQNYPNPFNSSTTIKFVVRKPGNMKIKISDVNGKSIATIIENYYKIGIYEVIFEANKLSSGIYFYNLASNNYSVTKKMVHIK